LADLVNYTVTLKNKEDLDSFYEDMETEGGSITIPNRMVETPNRRPISRNTQYMLTYEEAEQVKQDERVLDVIPTAFLEMKVPFWTEDMDFLAKNGTQDNRDRNWGFYTSTQSQDLRGLAWGNDGLVSEISRTINVNGSGKNVDVVIMDGHVDPDHPEYAINQDGTGGTRVVQYNWFQHDVGSGTGTYLYSPLAKYGDNHGAHVAGTACGNTHGWARSANIYNLNPYGQTGVLNGDLGAVLWDYVRAWHAAKSVNVSTGRKNPSIVNCSFGSAIQWNVTVNGNVYGPIYRIFYRGGDTGDLSGQAGGGATAAQLDANGIFNGFGTQPVIPFFSNADLADITDAIAEGIIIVAAAGNEYARVVDSTDQDYNNTFRADFNGNPFTLTYHRGTAPGAIPGVICVGSLDYTVDQRKSSFSNTGSRIDVFAPGTRIQSAVNDTSDSTGSGAVQDSRDSNYLVKKINGTSMASPQVCGVLACVMETFPNLTAQEALDMIVEFSAEGFMRDDGASASDLEALQGAPNRILVSPKFRPETGSAFPMRKYKLRPTVGIAYPRTRIRRKG
jgi:hypothetical protein